MSYLALARKWRPGNFKAMVGQDHVLQALVNALDSGRLHHAYLFSGTRGVGKTTIGRIFAKSLNCAQGIGSEPCGVCSSCQEVGEGRSLDLIEIDAASRTGVDDMRELLDNVQYTPTRDRFKIYLIDEVHMLSRHSFNALLKTLEEPPDHIKFLLATTDPQKIPVTILSRCLQFNLKRMSRQQIQLHLEYLLKEEAIHAESIAIELLASAADGSMRDGLSLLDQAIAYGAGEVLQSGVETMLGTLPKDGLLRILTALMQQDAAAMITEARHIISHNPDYQRICAELIELLQQMALYKSGVAVDPETDASGEQWLNLCAGWSMEEIQLYYQIVLQGRQDLKICPDSAAGFEMLMLRLLAFSPDTDVSAKPAPVDSGAQQVATEAAALSETTPVSVARPPEQGASEQAGISFVSSDKEAQLALRSDGSLDWSQLAYDLGLQGLAQEVVVNSIVDKFDSNLLRLSIPTALKELLNSGIEAEIRQALQAKIQVSCRLEIVAQPVLDSETPARVRMRELEGHRQRAITQIQQSSIVQKLQGAFGVELIESSVRKMQNSEIVSLSEVVA